MTTHYALAWAFHDVYVPIQRNEHIAAAALRADRSRVQLAGRWLVRHSPDRCSAVVGLALLAADWAEEDVGLIKIIGLLSDRFCPLAAAALKRRRAEPKPCCGLPTGASGGAASMWWRHCAR